MPRAGEMAAYVRDGYGAFRQPKFECGCCEMLVFRVCGVRQNLYVFSLYSNPDLDNRIFDCLLASMAAVLTLITPLCRQSFQWLMRFQTCLLVGKFSSNIQSTGIQDLPWRNIWLADNPAEVY